VPLHSDQNGDAQREHKSHDAPAGDAQSRGTMRPTSLATPILSVTSCIWTASASRQSDGGERTGRSGVETHRWARLFVLGTACRVLARLWAYRRRRGYGRFGNDARRNWEPPRNGRGQSAALSFRFAGGCLSPNRDSDKALLLLEEALTIVDSTQERWFEAERHRLRAETLLTSSFRCPDQAKVSLHRALALAREQGARFWELRAATSLARIQRSRQAYWSPRFARADLRSAPSRPNRPSGSPRALGYVLRSRGPRDVVCQARSRVPRPRLQGLKAAAAPRSRASYARQSRSPVKGRLSARLAMPLLTGRYSLTCAQIDHCSTGPPATF